MEKKITYSNVRLIIIIMSLITSVTSCKEDEEFGLEEILMQSGWKAAPYHDFLEWGNTEFSYSIENVTLYFVGNNTGIIKTKTKEFDTYFGESSSTTPTTFSYSIDGTSVTISNKYNSTTYHYEDGNLVDSDGAICYSKVSISTSEQKWLESTRYYFLPDDERYDIDFSHGCDVVSAEPINQQKAYIVTLSLGVEASQMARSRGFEYLRAKYKITGGKFTTTPQTTLFTRDDSGGEAYSSAIVTTSSEAKIEASFYVYDMKYGQEVLIDDAEYAISDDTTKDEEEEDEEEEDENDQQTDSPDGRYDIANYASVHTKAITYQIDGKKFKTILVDGGTMPAFYIMQTEIPIDKEIIVNGKTIRKIDANGNKVIIVTEFRNFIGAMRVATNMPLRLPTKEEWEYAARGGKYSKGYKYSGSNNINDVAWYYSNSGNKVHDIAQKKPNELDLYDMSGNYAELTKENDMREYYVDGYFCGGSWKNSESYCTVKSYKEGISSGKIPGSKTKEKNAFDASYISFRLVYNKQ